MRTLITCLLLFALFPKVCNGQQERAFPMASIPVVLTDPEKRAVYLVEHYWDRFDFRDTTLIHASGMMEQAMVNYIDLMKHEFVSAEVAASSIKEMMDKASVDRTMFTYLAGLYEKYLYDLDSPMRDESLYVPVLEAILKAPVWDEVSKVRPAHLLELALKNRVGEPAADFIYTLADGKQKRLYQTVADHLLLFFYDPDCDACKETTARLMASPFVAEWIKKGKLKILAVYPDEDLEAWKNHVSHLPASWINSYDATISLKNEEVYDLKAMPTLYLLGKDKKVVLKDVTFNQIEEYLRR